MRSALFTGLVAAGLALTIMPASAAWHGYVNREAGFSFIAPGEVKTDKATYRSATANQRNATVFRSVDNNIEFKVTVVDFTGRTNDEAALIKEASTQYAAGKKVLVDVEARVDQNYGRKMTADLANNGGRSMAGFYFKGGRLIQLEVTVLPANGDYGTPDTGRFVDSVAFLDSRVTPDATELTLSK